MKLFNFYIFGKTGDCLFYKEWSRPHNTLRSDSSEDRKLVFGMLFSLKDLANKLSPPTEVDRLRMVKTNGFCLHHYETITGLMFVLNTDCNTLSQHARLENVYKNLYIDYILRNPLYEGRKGQPIVSDLFARKLEEYLLSSAA